MRFDKFTIKSQESIQAAQQLAADRGHPTLEPCHVLAALLDQEEGRISITSMSRPSLVSSSAMRTASKVM